MALALKRIKAYAKLAAVVAVVAAILLVVLMNRSNTADVWFFHSYDGINVLWLILITAVCSILGWWGVRKIFGVLRDLREVRRLGRTQTQLDEQRRLAEELAERERRIDEKVRRSISGTAEGERT